ncbi:coproporphyrinogen-III oxidase family protein, partial [Nanoarchaeota archaeon]
KLWEPVSEQDVTDAWEKTESKSGALYVHIPFCVSKCGYCDYASNYGNLEESGAYIAAIEREAGSLSEIIARLNLESIFFGGGTPTTLSEEEMERILKIKILSGPINAEIAIEIYPWKEQLRDKMSLMKENGVTRASIGVQDFEDGVLAFSGRRYTGVEASQVVQEAMDMFETVNIDLICGLPKQTRWDEAIRKAITLGTQQITVQPFSNRHPGIRFYQDRYRKMMPGVGQLKAMYEDACISLTEAGYQQTSRHFFTRQGQNKYEGIITRSKPRLGLGAHSISLVDGFTYKNHTDLRDYMRAVADGELPVDVGFKIIEGDRMRSHIFYSLSADCGRLFLDEKEFEGKFGQRIQDAYPEEVEALEVTGLAVASPQMINLTRDGVYYISTIQRLFYNPDYQKIKEKKYGK